MTDHESKQFIKELLLAFPAFDDAARSSPDLGGTHKSWARAWADLHQRECMDALDTLIKSGGIGWDDYRQPGPFIRRLVLDARKAGSQSEHDTATAIERERAIARKRSYKGSPMAATLVKAIEMRQAGRPEEEILSAIETDFPPGNDFDGPRYRCLQCCDRGLVQVVRMDTMRKVAALEQDAERVTRAHTYLVACSCSAGSRVRERKPMQQSGKLPEFHHQQFCRWLDDGEDAKRIRQWVANHKPKNYDNSFDAWSA